MTTGASVDQAQWAAYRQVILEIFLIRLKRVKQFDDVVWPTQPKSTCMVLIHNPEDYSL